MTKVQSWIVFICSTAALIGFCFWFYAEPSFEPAIGIIAGIGGVVSSFWPFSPQKPRLSPEERIAARDKWRPIFRDYFLNAARKDYRGDCIVHDVNRLDDYPNTEENPKGISPWFRVGLMGTYEGGVLLGLRWTYLVDEGGTWKEYESRKPDGAVKVMLLGEVPYESIESVNFDGDDYYNKPHLFCHFEHGGEPYKRLFYGEEFRLDPGFPHHYREIAEYQHKPARWQFWKRGG